jgi:hypothetical protein
MLLSVAGCFAVPAASIAISRSSYSVVWPDKSLDKPAPERQITESRESVSPPSEPLPVLAKHQILAPSALLAPALFQRPPPAFPSLP